MFAEQNPGKNENHPSAQFPEIMFTERLSFIIYCSKASDEVDWEL